MKCKTCGETVNDKLHMCSADFIEGEECDYCGAVIPQGETLKQCKHLDEDATYVCNTCGRTAVKAEYLCNPNLIS